MKSINSLSEDEFADLVRRAARLPDAPPALLHAAIGLLSSAQEKQPVSATAVLRRIAAVLSFDSFASSQLAVGMRAAPSDTRHLLFSAMGRDIDLRISSADDRFVVAGQILGPDESGVVELSAQSDDTAGPRTASVMTLDRLGEFRIDHIRRGTYVLTLRVGDDEIVLPPIELSERGE